MKNLILVCILAVAFLPSIAQSDFRGFAWGISSGKVQADEKARFMLKTAGDDLQYADVLGGAPCNVLFIFNDNDKLTSGMYIFAKKYSNPQLYLQDYHKFRDLLTQKYGKPMAEKETWNGKTKLSEKTMYGQAVADGLLTMSAVWNTDRSLVKIVLLSSERHPSLQIHYTTISLDELENKADLQAALNKL